MKIRTLLLTLVVTTAATLCAQTKIIIPAGTPEDKDLQAISNEGDAPKRIPMLLEFVQKYSGNNAAVAYGYAQLAQLSNATGDGAKALEYGDKALAAMPDVVEILQTQVQIAQELKAWDKVVDYADRGAVVIRNVDKQPKPEGKSEADFQNDIAQQKKDLQPVYDFFEAAAYNAVATETNAKTRLTMAEKYLQAFPGSKFSTQATVQAIISLQEAKDTAGLVSFGQKAVAADPDDAGLLIVVANALSDAAGHEAAASTYAKKAIELTKAKPQDDTEARKTAGVAHRIVGYVLLKENKMALAVPELKTATTLLKDDPDDLAAAWFNLGFAYAKLEQATNALAALNQAAAIPGPYQAPAKEMAEKIKAVRKR